MDISPISAVRPVAPIRPALDERDLTRVGETGHLGQSGEHECTPQNRATSRGLEDEEDESEPKGVDAEAEPSVSSAGVNLFA
jgi:hypothetical protein